MKRLLSLLLVLLVIPSGMLAEETEEPYDWRAEWEEAGYLDFCDVQEDTLIVFEGVTALGEADTGYWDFEREEEVK